MSVVVLVLLSGISVSAGNLVSRDFPVRSFSEIVLKGVGNIFLTQGSKESVRIETDTTTFTTVELENEDNKLTISSTIDFNEHAKPEMNIYITVVNLQSVRFNDIGSVKSTNQLHTDSLRFFMSSAGKTAVDLQCKRLQVLFSGVGSFTAKGHATQMILEATGVGNIKMGEFVCEDAVIDFKGVGNVEANVTKNITINASGIGKVIYKGHPKNTNIQKNGIGTVTAE